ncbi:MAG: dethiobiotin synthase [Alphaproteobacteria bacterium]
MNAWFVTATGTDIGKTAVAACLLNAWAKQGKQPAAFKPVVSGYNEASPQGSDPYQLALALGLNVQDPAILHNISPWRFLPALSPDMAAARESKNIPFDAVVAESRKRIAAAQGPLLIEGAGGIGVPLDDTHLMRDLMTELGLPVVLVAGTYLGTISHTLTALDSLKMANIECAAIILSESVDSPVPPAETAAAIRRFVEDIPIGILPRQENEEAPWETAPDLTPLLSA